MASQPPTFLLLKLATADFYKRFLPPPEPGSTTTIEKRKTWRDKDVELFFNSSNSSVSIGAIFQSDRRRSFGENQLLFNKSAFPGDIWRLEPKHKPNAHGRGGPVVQSAGCVAAGLPNSPLCDLRNRRQKREGKGEVPFLPNPPSCDSAAANAGGHRALCRPGLDSVNLRAGFTEGAPAQTTSVTIPPTLMGGGWDIVAIIPERSIVGVIWGINRYLIYRNREINGGVAFPSRKAGSIYHPLAHPGSEAVDMQMKANPCPLIVSLSGELIAKTDRKESTFRREKGK
ncbi:hypothetical protein CDAR_240471 [Caerostris darwini]|uniref:Uncharacterized protein n=1 Tax=Caerostris darwini TaxID=1538125 RepID=A0AAV4PMY2_9ARAC|nr:hypothetical protein CDAR_240471 [Caerostris darwini]